MALEVELGGVTVTKTVKLKDQTEVVIRTMTPDDFEKSLAFFRALPEEDRQFLRRDVTKPEIIRERIREIEQGIAKRLLALVGDEIVADGALELAVHGWEKHVGGMRLIIARSHQRQGLGSLMARELYQLASEAGVEEILVRMMRPQTGSRRVFEKLGFREAAVLPNFAKDHEGKNQDLILMRCDLEGLWRKMEESIWETDWRGYRR